VLVLVEGGKYFAKKEVQILDFQTWSIWTPNLVSIFNHFKKWLKKNIPLPPPKKAHFQKKFFFPNTGINRNSE
jgi:maltose-binding protein MalE